MQLRRCQAKALAALPLQALPQSAHGKQQNADRTATVQQPQPEGIGDHAAHGVRTNDQCQRHGAGTER